MARVLIAGLLVAGSLLGGPVDTPDERVSVARFGATPDDGVNDADALRKAIAFCKDHPGTVLYLPPGVYDLRDEAAVQLMNDVMAGKMGQDPEKKIFTRYFPYVRGLDFRGLKDITVDAAGAVLRCDGWMEPVSLEDCRNITIKGLTIDYKRRPYSIGKVVETGDGYFDAMIEGQYPLNPTIPIPRMMFWDVKAHRMFPEPVYFPKKVVLTGPQTIRIYAKLPPGVKGNLVSLIHSFHFRPAILIYEADSIRLEDVTIHSQPGMGIVGHRASNITMAGLRVVPAPGSFVSTNTDATHFTSCTGLIRMEDCQFEGQGDDATNIHNYYYSIRKGARTASYDLVVGAPTGTHAQVLDYPDVGDRLELVKKSSLETVGTYTVRANVNHPQEWRAEVDLDRPLPPGLADYYLIDATRLPKVEIVGCSILSHLARGILIKTRNVRIERCLIRETTGTGIHVGAESFWHEGLPSADVAIRYNRIVRCGRGAGSQDGASGIAVKIDAKETTVPGLHKRLLIEGNIIEGEDAQRCISVSQAEDVVVRYNELSGCREPVSVRHSENVRVYANTVLNP